MDDASGTRRLVVLVLFKAFIRQPRPRLLVSEAGLMWSAGQTEAVVLMSTPWSLAGMAASYLRVVSGPGTVKWKAALACRQFLCCLQAGLAVKVMSA